MSGGRKRIFVHKKWLSGTSVSLPSPAAHFKQSGNHAALGRKRDRRSDKIDIRDRHLLHRCGGSLLRHMWPCCCCLCNINIINCTLSCLMSAVPVCKVPRTVNNTEYVARLIFRTGLYYMPGMNGSCTPLTVDLHQAWIALRC